MASVQVSAEERRVSARHVFAVIVGNALEFYDFLTYAFFAVQIGRTFFPAQNPSSSLLLSLATFGAGFLMRPVGGLVIGRMGDRIGRRPAMLFSFGCMGLAMAGLAATPGYAAIGLAAPVLVIAFRLLQGFALGGEVGPTTAYLIEAAPPGRRGLYTSLQYATQGVAIMAAGVVGFVLARVLTPQALDAWGWRLALLLGTLIVPFGLIVRRTLPETFERSGEKGAAPPSIAAHARIAVLGLMIFGGGTIATYVLNYLTTFATVTLHMPTDVAFVATVIVGFSDTCLSIVSGWLSDKVGRKPLMISAWIVLLLVAVPAFTVLTRLATPAALWGMTLLMSVSKTFGTTPALIALTEALPPGVRARALGLTYATAVAVFGGSTQFIVTWLIDATGNPVAPAWYMAVAIAVGLSAMTLMPETAPIRRRV